MFYLKPLFGKNKLVALLIELKVKKSQKDDFLNPEIFKKKSTKTLHWEFNTVGANEFWGCQ